uniref:Uncharacterized protein n=1 Tax=viral metagenome TaxID=1070528 RepID=A0A6H1ZVM9_9ZZZZ
MIRDTMIKARLYRNKKGIILNLSGDVDEIKLNNKETMLVWVEKDGRELKMRPVDDIKPP